MNLCINLKKIRILIYSNIYLTNIKLKYYAIYYRNKIGYFNHQLIYYYKGFENFIFEKKNEKVYKNKKNLFV